MACAAMTSVTNSAIIPKAPSAIDSGFVASSTWVTTGAVAWNSCVSPLGIAATTSCSTPATSRDPR